MFKENKGEVLHGILLIVLFSFSAFYIAEFEFVKQLSFSPLIVGIILGMLYANSLRVVFLQGCNFRCLYCANPDTIDACGGKPTPAEEILRMATDQKPFFGRRGGVTFSGGEPTFQATALVPLVRQCLTCEK